MTDQEADEKFERLSEQIDNLPDEPPIVQVGPSRSLLAVSIVQLVFVVFALIGVVASISRVQTAASTIENNRIDQCVSNNQFRKDVAAVLFDASKAGTSSPAATEFYNRSISRFSLTDCVNPSRGLIPLDSTNVNTKSTRSNP